MSQEELAKKVGYKSRSSINKIELARSLPLSKVEIMATALDCTPSYLMGWTDEENEAISTIRNKLDPVPPKGEITETERHILFCYHLLSAEMKENVDEILERAYDRHLREEKKNAEGNFAS